MYKNQKLTFGLTLAPMTKAFGSYFPAVLCLLTGIGTLIVYFSHNPFGLGAGMLLIGLCHFCMWPGLVGRFNSFVPAESMGFISGLISAALNFGMFLTASFISIVANVTGSDSPRAAIPVGTAGILIIMVLFFFLGKIGRAENK